MIIICPRTDVAGLVADDAKKEIEAEVEKWKKDKTHIPIFGFPVQIQFVADEQMRLPAGKPELHATIRLASCSACGEDHEAVTRFPVHVDLRIEGTVVTDVVMCPTIGVPVFVTKALTSPTPPVGSAPAA